MTFSDIWINISRDYNKKYRGVQCYLSPAEAVRFILFANLQGWAYNTIMELTAEEKRIWVKGLLIRCPYGLGKEILNCPFRELRKLPLNERMLRINSLPDEEIAELFQYHQECSRARGQGAAGL